ncbi:MAG: hypothetical protein AAF721_06370 [Myxococcota bacterium]
MSTGRRPQQNVELLRALTAAEFDFCIVGGVAAALHGSTRMTVDLDIAAPFDEDNLGRLLVALSPHDPRHATRPELRVADESLARLTTFRMLLIETTLGRLDVLRDVSPLGKFSELRTVTMDLGSLRCAVVSIDDLITIKRSLPRPKDREVALELEAIRASRTPDVS